MPSRRRPHRSTTTRPNDLSFNHDGAADEEYHTEEADNLLSRKNERGRRAYLVALQWWADEYKSAIICGLSIIILSIVLWYYDGKLVPSLSPGLDLDMLVIALVTVSRVAMGNVVEACISQCAWIWISKSHQQRTNTVARLEDFKIFDEASRGFLGSVALI
ncbi:arginase family protein [Cordyceps javanica]|uniref:Arginase family protein n=1 Tax=Cordyceps javanica TaxID=43265 RepID=A0A545V5F9_9HYPO|nr:arginase family protein [Cordyceps javanica]TQW08208.1 arginase family protein [Cordyceps javanica]